MQKPTAIRPYAGSRGFTNIPTGRLTTSLREYKRLRDHPNTTAELRAYARSVINEIHEELQRRGGGRKAVAA